MLSTRLKICTILNIWNTLEVFDVKDTHTGYFSIDKKNRAINSEVKRGYDISDDISAYNLILKNKEALLDIKRPERFIFSHSALREGWDNPKCLPDMCVTSE